MDSVVGILHTTYMVVGILHTVQAWRNTDWLDGQLVNHFVFIGVETHEAHKGVHTKQQKCYDHLTAFTVNLQ